MEENSTLQWAKRLQAISQSGLAYVRDPFDKERYEAIRAIAAEMIAAQTDASDLAATALKIDEIFADQAGYATPKLDTRGVVFRQEADGAPALLLVKERSDNGWTLPGGWVDIGETPSQAVEKEVREESGYNVRAVRILGVLDRDKQGHPAQIFAVWKVFLLCELLGGTASGDGVETDEVAFFREEEIVSLPLSLNRILPSQITWLFERYRSGITLTDFD